MLGPELPRSCVLPGSWSCLQLGEPHRGPPAGPRPRLEQQISSSSSRQSPRQDNRRLISLEPAVFLLRKAVALGGGGAGMSRCPCSPVLREPGALQTAPRASFGRGAGVGSGECGLAWAAWLQALPLPLGAGMTLAR